MPFNISNKTYDQNFLQGSNLTRAFYDAVIAHLKKHRDIPRAAALLDWVSKGGSLAPFVCRSDFYKEMEAQLDEANSPYLRVISRSGKMGFIVADHDITRTTRAIDNVFSRKSRYCSIVPVRLLGESMGSMKSRLCILSNLDVTRAMRIKRTIKEKMPINTIGLDRMKDGTYRIGLLVSDLEKVGARGLTVRQIILETELLLNGPDRIKAADGERRHLDQETFLAENKDRKDISYRETPLYVAGRYGDYMKYTGDGFDFGHIRDINGEFIMSRERTVAKEDPEYRDIEISLRNRMIDPIATFAFMDCISYTKENLIRADLSYAEKEKEASREKAVGQMDRMVNEKLDYDLSLGHIKDPGDRQTAYQREAAVLIDQMNKGRIPDGYRKEDVITLSNDLVAAGITVEAMEELHNGLKSYEIENREYVPTLETGIRDYIKQIELSDARDKTLTREELGL